MNSTRKYILFFIIGIVTLITGYVVAYNYLNSTDLTISAKNIASYNVTLSGSIIHSSTQKSDAVRVPKSSNISIEFKGVDGYETNTKEIQIGQSPKSITVEPFYSKEHLATLIESERSLISKSTNDYQTNISNLYTLDNFTLYHFGDWASVTLKWKGEYSQNSDNQKVILKKESGNWKVIGEPSILFFYKNYPDIPTDILRSVNNSSV